MFPVDSFKNKFSPSRPLPSPKKQSYAHENKIRQIILTMTVEKKSLHTAQSINHILQLCINVRFENESRYFYPVPLFLSFLLGRAGPTRKSTSALLFM